MHETIWKKNGEKRKKELTKSAVGDNIIKLSPKGGGEMNFKNRIKQYQKSKVIYMNKRQLEASLERFF